MADKKAPTLDDLLKNEFGVDTYQGPGTGVVSVGTTATKVCQLNPNRVGLTFINNSINTIYLFTDNSVSSSRGIQLAGGGGSISFNWRDDLVLNAQEWFGIAPAGPSNIFVLEVLTK